MQVTSPTKKITQARKPSGKSTKSNRTSAIVTKKSFMPGSNQ